MGLQGPNTAEWFERASASLINGVSSQFRYWGDDDTIVIDHGEAGHLVDMDGKRYVDYQLGFGPIILGHGDAAAAAAAATVDQLSTGEPLARVEKVGTALMEGLGGVLSDKGVESTVTGHPSMFSIYLGEEEPKEFRDAAGHDEDLCFRMIDKGVMPCPDALEPWFVCAAHTDEDVATTLQVFEESLTESLAAQ